ncbi:MAG TPA: DEAD/DEAH box helicase [Chryseolinea sp.]|nr:DEAD/DEAH box helicase [Chryseolinea sp.]
MAIFAGFVGIDRYQDPHIRDLAGAKRDAIALWALLSDSIQDLSATILLDDNASLDNINDLLAKTLDAATVDDIAIITFAGHGTKDHRLVCADSNFSILAATTIGMADLAARFRSSKARVVICILDCCFSGGAPARVLEDSVILRALDPKLDEVGGKGRILISASNVDEPALEDPKTRHGLFTKALIECLQKAAAPVNILAVINETIPLVRAAAARFGRTQTPVLFGYVEGEMSLPKILAGNNFMAAFPESFGEKISSNFQDLTKYGIDQGVIELWKNQFAAGLNSLQMAAINDHGVLLGNSLLVVAPTSAGKTFVGELASIKAIQQGEKAVFLLPYKALVNEKYDDFQALYGDQIGLRVVRCSGDWQDQTSAIIKGKYDIAFFTYETFLNLSLIYPHLLNQTGLIVLDEGQFITDSHRGIVVELLLTNIVSVRKRGIHPQVLVLSAVIGNINGFEKWLDSGVLQTSERPVPLIEGVLDRRGVLQQKDVDNNVSLIQLVSQDQIFVRRSEPSSQDMIVPLVRQLVSQGEKVIVFRNNRGSTAGCAEYLANELDLPAAQGVIDLLPQVDPSSTSQRLVRCLGGGTAFHTADLKREERSVVENAFRKPNSSVHVLVATSTIAAGVNTPASTVIIVETNFPGKIRTPYSVATYKNMAGRAGRLGYEKQGRTIMLADSAVQREQLFRKYVQGSPEPFSSSFDPNHPETWMIRLLAQVDKIGRSQAIDLVANTYGGFLKNLFDANWQPRFQAQIAVLIRRMEKDGLIDDLGTDQIQLSMLGHACGQSPLSLNSALRLVEMLNRLGGNNVSAMRLMALVQALQEQDDDYTPLGRGRLESSRPSEVTSKYGAQITGALQHQARTDEIYYARCKRALILYDWTNGVSLEDIEKAYTPNPFSPVGHGDIRGYADATRFYIGSASRIAAILFPGMGPTEVDIDNLLTRLDIGLPSDALQLIKIPITLVRGEYLALYNANAKTIEEIRTMSEERLSKLVGETRAKQLLVAVHKKEP